MSDVPVQLRAQRSRLRVLVVGHSLSGGGAERFTSVLLTHLDRHRFDPHLVTLTGDATYPLSTDVPHTKLAFHGLWSLRRTVSQLQRVIDECEPDVLLSTFDLPTLVTGFAAPRKNAAYRWIARLGLAVNRPAFSLLDAISRPGLSRFYRRVDHFVANSQGLADSFVKKYSFAKQRMTAIHNPVDVISLEALAAQHPVEQRKMDQPLLIFVGRLHQQKRLDVLLDAYALLREKFRPQLWILGEGPQRGEIEKRIASAGWQSDVRLFGFQKNPFPLVRQAELFVLTSDFEGLPNALLEAQALGIPAVATRANFGPEEIVQDNVTGKLVACGNAPAFAAACSALLTNEPLRIEMSQSAQRIIADRFALHTLIRHWEDVLAEGVRRH